MSENNRPELANVINATIAAAVDDAVRRACRCAWLVDDTAAAKIERAPIGYHRLQVRPRRRGVSPYFLHVEITGYAWDPSDGLVLQLVTTCHATEIDYAGAEHAIQVVGTSAQLASVIEDLLLDDGMDLTVEAERAADARNVAAAPAAC